MKKDDKKNIYYFLALYSGLGFTMVIFTIMCMYFGMYLDRTYNTGGNFALAMTLFGMIFGGWWTYRRIIKNAIEVDKKEKIKKNENSREESDDKK